MVNHLSRVGLAAFLGLSVFCIFSTFKDYRFALRAFGPLPEYTLETHDFRVEPDGTRIVMARKIVSVRALDGAISESITMPVPGAKNALELPMARVITYPSQIAVAYAPSLNAKSTYYLTKADTDDKLNKRQLNKYCVSSIEGFAYLGSEQVLGFEAHKLQYKMKDPRGMVRFTSWRVPELACQKVKETQEVEEADHYRLLQETLPVVITRTARLDLFDVPAAVPEQKPSEIFRRHAATFGRVFSADEMKAIEKANDASYNIRRSNQ